MSPGSRKDEAAFQRATAKWTISSGLSSQAIADPRIRTKSTRTRGVAASTLSLHFVRDLGPRENFPLQLRPTDSAKLLGDLIPSMTGWTDHYPLETMNDSKVS